jgi:hypothetical protein
MDEIVYHYHEGLEPPHSAYFVAMQGDDILVEKFGLEATHALHTSVTPKIIAARGVEIDSLPPIGAEAKQISTAFDT